MTKSISVSKDVKSDFDDLKPDDYTQSEFVEELLETYQKDVQGVVIDAEEIAQEINHLVASEVELSAYRGTIEALEKHE